MTSVSDRSTKPAPAAAPTPSMAEAREAADRETSHRHDDQHPDGQDHGSHPHDPDLEHGLDDVHDHDDAAPLARESKTLYCSASGSSFSMREARTIVQGLNEPQPRTYWTDLLASAAVGFTAFLLFRPLTAYPVLQAISFIVAALALYRLAIFTHELTHLRDEKVPGFRLAWNILCGIPFLMPAFMYDTHRDHHRRNAYGTKHDGEYLPLAKGPISQLFIYLCQVPVIPLLAIVRFGLLTPLSFAIPKLRTWVLQHASSMIMDHSYVRPLPKAKELRVWAIQEWCCFALVAGNAVAILSGVASPWVIVRVYLTSVTILTLNAFRTMAAHRFRNHDGHEMNHLEQLLDSVNITGNRWTTELWAPVGLRYHALHHLFPSMPYHNLAEAHSRLMAQLPADSPYRQTVSPSLFSALYQLWCDARRGAAGIAAAKADAGATTHSGGDPVRG